MKKPSDRRAYRKHIVLIKNKYIPVKDWYRDNAAFFQHINGVPTSEQIGVVLIARSYGRFDSETEVIYRK
jgi:hypothetical protein